MVDIIFYKQGGSGKTFKKLCDRTKLKIKLASMDLSRYKYYNAFSFQVNYHHGRESQSKKLIESFHVSWASPIALVGKNTPASTRDVRGLGLIPGLGRSPGEGNGNPLQCSCLENTVVRGAWWDTVHRVVKRRT